MTWNPGQALEPSLGGNRCTANARQESSAQSVSFTNSERERRAPPPRPRVPQAPSRGWLRALRATASWALPTAPLLGHIPALRFTFIPIIGGFYFLCYLASCGKHKAQQALLMLFSALDLGGMPRRQPPSGRGISSSNLQTFSKSFGGQPFGTARATALLRTLRFHILTAASWFAIESPYLNIWNGISERQVCPFQVLLWGDYRPECVIAHFENLFTLCIEKIFWWSILIILHFNVHHFLIL